MKPLDEQQQSARDWFESLRDDICARPHGLKGCLGCLVLILELRKVNDLEPRSPE